MPTTPHLETPIEERWSTITHAIGAGLSGAAMVVLITLAGLRGSAIVVVSVTLYAGSLFGLYLASTLFHGCPHRLPQAKHCLKAADHIAIYWLIAGTYTPFLLVLLGGAWGWSLLGILIGLALLGTIFKIFFTRLLLIRWIDVTSSLIYVAMGWIGIIALKPFLASVPGGALLWILAGGVTYSVGVIFYLWDRLPFNHAIWHLFVMGGSACHFFAVLLYVVPN